MGERTYIVTTFIKKLKKGEKEWVLSPQGFKRVSDDKTVDISKLPEDDKGLYYKDEPYTTKKLQQRLIITYSPKYALYQKSIRSKQIERAQAMLDSGNTKKNRRNPNNSARFIGTAAVTKESETADIRHYLDEHKISEESQYDGLYAVCTNLLDDEVSDILRVSEDLLDIMQMTTGKMPYVFALSTQDITPYGNNLFHLNSILQPSTATEAPVVGVAITTEVPVAGCATGATHAGDLEEAARFVIETAKAYGRCECEFYDKEEFERIVSKYGNMKHIQTLGK